MATPSAAGIFRPPSAPAPSPSPTAMPSGGDSPSVDASQFDRLAHPKPIEGWASALHLTAADDGPAVIPAPDATPQALIAWAMGQLGQLNVLLTTIGMADGFGVQVDATALASAIRHPLEQAEAALDAAIHRLHARHPAPL